MLIIGHRGASEYAPENTFSSFDLAIKMGCNSIETDIRKTKDDELVLLHDETVDRTTDGKGSIDNYTLEEVNKLDAGMWFSTDFKGEKIPTLKEFLSRYGNMINLTLEIKDENVEELVVSTINESDINKDNITLTSFSFETLLNLKKNYNEFTYGYLEKNVTPEVINKCVDNNIDQICPSARSVSAEVISIAHSHDLLVRVYGVKSEEVMKKVVDFGVDGMTIDFPDRLIEYLGS